ncbi:MAG: cell division protein FtsQ/DivIB [Candidatus Dormibacteria bacterium]
MSPPRQQPARSRGFGAVVPEGFEAWRPALEFEDDRPGVRSRRPQSAPEGHPIWARIPDSEVEEVARQAAERRRARETARRRFLGRHRVSAPRRPIALEALPGVSRTTRVLALLLVLITAAAVLLFALPWLKVQRVEVEGAAVVPKAQLLHDAGAHLGESTILLNAPALTRNLLAQSWVKSAAVRVSWPGTLILAVTPLPPVMVYRQGVEEQRLAASGAALGPPAFGGPKGLPLLVDQRQLPLAQPGEEVLPARLTKALVELDGVFPATYGVAVSRYLITATGALEIRSSAGWTADLGPTVTRAQITAVGRKLEALRALAGEVNLSSAGIKQIYLEDPRQVVLKY